MPLRNGEPLRISVRPLLISQAYRGHDHGSLQNLRHMAFVLEWNCQYSRIAPREDILNSVFVNVYCYKTSGCRFSRILQPSVYATKAYSPLQAIKL
jgi:hypothetical protein